MNIFPFPPLTPSMQHMTEHYQTVPELRWPHLCTGKRAVGAVDWKAWWVLGAPLFNSRAVSFALNHGLFQTDLQFSPLQFQSFTDPPFNLKEQNQCQRYKGIALMKKSDFNLCLSGDFLGKTRLVGRFVFKTTSPLGRKHLRGRN